MHPLILFIKTYRRDFERVRNLLSSIEQYNKNNIPLFVSVNDEDFSLFKTQLPSDITLLRDSDIINCKVRDGWRYQQIIKSQVHKLNICDNYVCIDSDSEFIRNFYISDFMYDDKTPYTIMHESKDMLEIMEVINKKSSQAFYKEALRILRTYWGGTGKEWDYGPSPFIWSTKVWTHFEEHFLAPNNFSFETFLLFIEEKGASPSEYMIYGEYLFKNRIIDIIPIQPLFKFYHYQEQYILEKHINKVNKLRHNYLGIVKQSNWDEPKNHIHFRKKLKLEVIRKLLKNL